jgi:hypothetical protein
MATSASRFSSAMPPLRLQVSAGVYAAPCEPIGEIPIVLVFRFAYSRWFPFTSVHLVVAPVHHDPPNASRGRELSPRGEEGPIATLFVSDLSLVFVSRFLFSHGCWPSLLVHSSYRLDLTVLEHEFTDLGGDFILLCLLIPNSNLSY